MEIILFYINHKTYLRIYPFTENVLFYINNQTGNIVPVDLSTNYNVILIASINMIIKRFAIEFILKRIIVCNTKLQ